MTCAENKTIKMRALLSFFLMLLVFNGCTKESPRSTGLTATNAYMYAPAPGQMHGAVYLRLENSGVAARQLVDISADVAGSAMVHRTVYENGMMKMRHVHHLALEPGQTLLFEPNGFHIMLVDLDNVPDAGGEFVIGLAFDQGETLKVPVAVKNQQ